MQSRVIVNSEHFNIILRRLCYQIIENHFPFQQTVLIGIQPRGTLLLNAITTEIRRIHQHAVINEGKIDSTFYRDDFRTSDKLLVPNETQINYTIDNKNIVLIDDVLYTGRTIRSAMEALMEYGRPNKIELLTFVDRRFSRELPIEPNYVGMRVDSVNSEKVKVEWNKENTNATIWIIPKTPIQS